MRKSIHSELSDNGDYCFTDNTKDETVGINIKCPGCGNESYLQFADTSSTVEKASKWKWNGNKDKPTLRPSLLFNGCCNWHGYLTDGKLKVC